MTRCFLIEPIRDPEKLLSYECWDRHSITGWSRADTGEVAEHISDFGVGAMWFATWYPRYWQNETGPHLIVATPGGSWDVDSRCSNCTLIADELHRCWVRHGEPPNVTVDKNGLTCGAGAGSIICGNYHGFLQNGALT